MRNAFALQSPLTRLTFTRNTTKTQMRGQRRGSSRAISHQYPCETDYRSIPLLGGLGSSTRKNCIDSGWLRPYPENELGPPRWLIPLMAILQENKQKVQPVMYYRELNKHVDPYTAGADVCTHKLREWRQQGSDVAILDLRRTYLQIRVEKSLWPFQTVEIKGTRNCLTRLGFSLHVAPSIMTAIMSAI